MKVIPPLVTEGKKAPVHYLKKEVIHLPFFVFRAIYSGGREIFVMVDGIKGKTVRVEPWILDKGEEKNFEINVEISQQEAKEIALQEARFPVSIFFKKRMESLELMESILYPFLIYYKRKGEGYNIDVYDGVTGKRENFFAREIIIAILMKEVNRSVR